MRRPGILAVLAFLVAPAVAWSQAPQLQAAGPISAALISAWQRASVNMPAAAEMMPPEKFSFKPTPEQMSFGEIIAHEAQSNETLCGAIAGGSKPPTESAAGATAIAPQRVS